MSTQYRKADCQSTKNVMGDKGVDPQSGPSGVSLGFKVQPEHAYLGHFKQEKFLREGHNSIFGDILGGARDALGGAADRFRNPMGGGGGSSAPTMRRPDAVGTTLSGNIVSRTGGNVKTQIADTARRNVAKMAIRSGGPGAAAVAAERPVLAARMATRGMDPAARRAAVSAARLDPNSARSERRAKRGL